MLKSELGRLKFCFERGKLTYKQYLENGSVYLYAKILKDNNTTIKDILTQVFHLMPEEQQKAALQLIHHIDVWMSLWECLEQEIEPKPFDKFVFQNTVNYPAEAELSLCNLYSELD